MWEYRVVRWPSGQYTDSLNAYALEGWELVEVVRDDAPPPPPAARSFPAVPGTIGRIGAAAETLGKLADQADDPAAQPSSLLWVLRRARDTDG